MKRMGSTRFTPAGYVMLPSSISLYVLLTIRVTGGYNLRTSYKIMVTCTDMAQDQDWCFSYPIWIENLSTFPPKRFQFNTDQYFSPQHAVIANSESVMDSQ